MNGPGAAGTASSNHPDWNEASTKLIRLNHGRPIIMSYGPDGTDQLTAAAMTAAPGGANWSGPPSLVGDFMHNGLIDHPLNADNVYADQGLKEKLTKGPQQ